MKGILESIPEFFQIVAGIAVAVILIFLAFQLTSTFRDSSEANLSGDNRKISSSLAKYIETCWDQNRNGLSPTSSICKYVNISSSTIVSEFNVAKLLNCDGIPDNLCPPDNCDFCISKRYSENQDRVKWFITDDRNFTISYNGYERAVLVGQGE